MQMHTSNLAMSKAIDNMILVCSENTSEESVTASFTSDMVVGELLDYLLGEIWTGVLKHLNLYGYAVNAGQAAGKLLTGWLFGTDESVEMYYSACALYEFEDALRAALSYYESQYVYSQSDSDSAVFNECYKLLLKTYLLGSKTSQKFVDVEYKHGLIKQLLFNFKEEKYNEYSEKLKNITGYVEQTLEFMNVVAYNGYCETYCSDVASIIDMVPKTETYTEDDKQQRIELLNTLSLETNNWIITKDMTLNSDIHTYGYVNLQYGTLNINGHRLEVDGDFIIANVENFTENGVTTPRYYSTTAVLQMTDPADYVKINGDFISYAGSSYNTSYVDNSLLNAGVMEVSGDFNVYSGDSYNYYMYSFYTGGSHKVILNGTDEQNVSFDYPWASGFTNVEFKNPNINFNSGIKGFTLQNDINLLNECLLIYGTIDMNGYTINRQGNLYLTDGILNLNGGKLNIDGDFAIAGVEYITDSGIKTPTFYSTGAMLQMTNISDYIKIGGDFINFGSSTYDTAYSGNSLLNAGTMELHGDFKILNDNAFYTANLHKVIFNGTSEQEIYFADPYSSRFTNVEFENPDINITNGIQGFTLTSDIVWNDMLLNIFGTMDLNGHTLSIKGDLIQTNGELFVNGGNLNIDGDYIIANVENVTENGVTTPRYYSTTAVLQMTDPADYVKINGNFISYAGSSYNTSYVDNSLLNAGVMEVSGDFNVYSGDSYSYYMYSFYTGGSHKVILNGTDEQNVSFDYKDYSGFNSLVIESVTGKINFITSANIRSKLTQPGGAEIQSRDNVTLQNKPAFEDHGELNAAINKYVGNAENVIPTWMDYEAYINQTGSVEPTPTPPSSWDYTINKITAENGNVSIDLTKNSGSGGKLIAASYTSDGTLVGVTFKDIALVDNELHTIDLELNTDDAAYITAFMWDNITSMKPISEKENKDL
jgi:hypothetical protein